MILFYAAERAQVKTKTKISRTVRRTTETRFRAGLGTYAVRVINLGRRIFVNCEFMIIKRRREFVRDFPGKGRAGGG